MSGEQLHIVGARPNFMKAAPVVAAAKERGIPTQLVHTGQHYDQAMSHIFFEQLGMPEPDLNLGVGSGSHAKQTADLMVAIEETLLSSKPSCVVVYGDINSTLAAALVASKLHIPVAHVEAGLRSFDRTMPEEVNRIVTDSLSDLLFVTSPEGLVNLGTEGVSARNVHFVGNPMIDTLKRFVGVLEPGQIRSELGLSSEYGVVTVHRPSNVDDPKAAERIVEILRQVSDRLRLVVPLHPRGRGTLTKAGIMELAGVSVIDPLGYLEFMALVSQASVVMTDSGGIQEETTVLGIPCITLRDNTERPITVSHGTNVLVGNDPQVAIPAAWAAIQKQVEPQEPPLWDGQAGQRIADVLRQLLD